MRTIFKTNYKQDIKLLKHQGYVFWYVLLFVAIILSPVFLSDFYVGELSFIFIYAIASLGLMIMLGFTGLPSFGHVAFFAIGGYAQAIFLDSGVPFLISFILAGTIGAAVGGLIAVPLKRMTGIYFGIATLVFSLFVSEVAVLWKSLTNGLDGMSVGPPSLFGYELVENWQFYYLCLFVLLIVLFNTLNLLRSPTGRAFIAVRDSEVSAESMGINLGKHKIMSIAISGGFTGLAGALYAHKLSFIAPDAFSWMISIHLLIAVVVGGLGTVHGAIFGAVFIALLPQAIGIAKDYLPHSIGEFPGLEPGIFGLILVLFLIFEPFGMYGRWLKLKLYLEMFPLYRKATFKKQKSYLKTERVQ